MACCATGECGRHDYSFHEPGMAFVDGRWHCYLCYILPRLFPKQPGGHQEKKLSEAAATRDGDPKLAAERKRNPVFEKRQRAGPNYVPSARRV